jgi:hypothetical protein
VVNFQFLRLDFDKSLPNLIDGGVFQQVSKIASFRRKVACPLGVNNTKLLKFKNIDMWCLISQNRKFFEKSLICIFLVFQQF